MSVRSFQTIVDDHAAANQLHRKGLRLASTWYGAASAPMFQCQPTGVMMGQEFECVKDGFSYKDFVGHHMDAPQFMPGGSVNDDMSYFATEWIDREAPYFPDGWDCIDTSV